jgi:hypothetical protein
MTGVSCADKCLLTPLSFSRAVSESPGCRPHHPQGLMSSSTRKGIEPNSCFSVRHYLELPLLTPWIAARYWVRRCVDEPRRVTPGLSRQYDP